MCTMIFRFVDGIPAPMLPTNPDGTPRSPDGVLWMSVEQVARRANATVEALKRLWLIVWGDAVDRRPAAHGAADHQEPPRLTDRVGRQARRCVDFGHLSDDEYAYVEDYCAQRGLDLWSRHVWAVHEWDHSQRRQVVRLRMTVDGMRARAVSTGQAAGYKAATFGYAHHERFPTSATVVVYRAVGGKKRAFEATAYWDNYCPADVEGSFWDRMPQVMLEKCAECLALRRAYPELFGDIYSPEETERSRQMGAPHRGPRRPPQVRVEAVNADDVPESMTQIEFHNQLSKRGLADNGKRNSFIAIMRAKYPGVEDENPQAFYRAALERLIRSPGAYGATPPGSEMA